MKRLILGVLSMVLLYACSVDYTIEDISSGIAKQIIINGYLVAEQPVAIHLYHHEGEKDNKVKGLMQAHLILKEDGQVLYDGICSDSLFTLDHLPKAGAKYELEASAIGYETVKATTTIPYPIVCKADFNAGDDDYSMRDDLVTLSNFTYNPFANPALWIISQRISEVDEVEQYNEIYADNVFVDKTNSFGGMGAPNDVVGGMYHEGYLRVKSKYVQHLTDIVFTPTHASYWGVEGMSSPQNRIRVELIAASPEFDKYNKSLYQQKSMIVYDEDISSIFYQPKSVYSNIENGTGIFAGISKTSFVFDYPVYKRFNP